MRMPEPVAPPSDGVFTVGRRGYDPHQVDAHLRRMDAEIRILVADRDAAVDQAAQLGRDLDEARLRADRLRTQVRTMAARPSDVQGMSERMRTMLRLAEDEVADMLRRADEEVARRIGEAERSVGQITEGARREAADILPPCPCGGGDDSRRGCEAPGRGRGGRGGRPRVDRRGARRRRAGDRPRHRARRAGAHVGMGGVGAPARDGRGRLLHRDGPAPRRGADGDPGRAGAHRSVGAAQQGRGHPAARAPRSPRPRRPPAG